LFPRVLGGIAGLSVLSLLAFMFTIGGGRPTGPGILLALAVSALGAVAYLIFQSARMLVSTGAAAEEREAQAAVGRRRKELEREYFTLKRALKELELDYAMGKLSEQDYSDIRTRYRERAVRILRQLDQGESYRAQIERDLEARRAARGQKPRRDKAAPEAKSEAKSEARPEAKADTRPELGPDARPAAEDDKRPADAGAAEARPEVPAAEKPCAKCGARNDNDAVFCKKCGARLS
jgi:ribosomal protein L40E